jgi:cyclophilin family peptidyl-prolyl cis-trans isomerase
MSFPCLTTACLRALIGLLVILLSCASTHASNVTMSTPLGDVEIELFDEAAPATVANFLQYLNDGSYENSFLHRSDPGFVLQGGGFVWEEGIATAVVTKPPVVNEPGTSNLRGTIAMAKQAGNPNSATSQWFFNLQDNVFLDSSNGGFTVFGQVVGNGMEVIDQIAQLSVWNFGVPFAELPLINYSGSGPLATENLVLTELNETSGFPINAGLNDAWFFPGTAGQGFFVIVYPEIESLFLSWFTFDTVRPDDSVTALLGDPGHRWLTGQGNFSGSKAMLDVFITSGGVFDSGSPKPETVPDGTMVVEFSGCNEGSVTFDIPSIDRQDVVPIQRVFADSTNLALCEEIAAQLLSESATP